MSANEPMLPCCVPVLASAFAEEAAARTKQVLAVVFNLLLFCYVILHPILELLLILRLCLFNKGVCLR
jgi:hypothetical protein